jgi:hypothetical protein
MLDDLLKPGQPLPSDAAMIAHALGVLNHSPHGQKLAGFAEKEKINIKVIATPQPTTYLPETRTAYIGFNRNNPVSPARFILMLAAVLREAEQELAGIKATPFQAQKPEFVKVGMAKYEDIVWHLCAVASELNDQSAFAEYRFLDELGKMGHTEAMELFLKQERNHG